MDSKRVDLLKPFDRFGGSAEGVGRGLLGIGRARPGRCLGIARRLVARRRLRNGEARPCQQCDHHERLPAFADGAAERTRTTAAHVRVQVCRSHRFQSVAFFRSGVGMSFSGRSRKNRHYEIRFATRSTFSAEKVGQGMAVLAIVPSCLPRPACTWWAKHPIGIPFSVVTMSSRVTCASDGSSVGRSSRPPGNERTRG